MNWISLHYFLGVRATGVIVIMFFSLSFVPCPPPLYTPPLPLSASKPPDYLFICTENIGHPPHTNHKFLIDPQL